MHGVVCLCLSKILNTGLVTIAGGMIFQLQILDVAVYKVFRDWLHQPNAERLLFGNCTLTPAENCLGSGLRRLK
jgi:hypothetical protein